MSFTAKYGGICAECDGRIQPGQEIEYDSAGDLQHAICAPAPTAGFNKGVCTDCWQELPASGVCGVCDV